MASFVAAGRLQLIGLIASALLGLIPGLLFAAGATSAWQITYATFLWSLIAGLAVVIVAGVRGKVAYGAWKQGLALSTAVFFSHTTLYLAVLLVLAMLGQSYEPRPMPRPALVELAPLFYGSSAAMTVFSGPLFFRWVGPSR